MLFHYQGIDPKGVIQEGEIDAPNGEIAVLSLQRRGLVISSIKEMGNKKGLFSVDVNALFERVSTKDIVILSRQMATLFSAQVSALRIFRLLGGEASKPVLRTHLTEIADDLQGGSSMSKALSRHPKLFSEFYVNMVRAGEESGKLDQTFNYLADYLDRTYEVTSKAKHALVYPAFVVFTFVAVMVLMLTMVIPKLSAILDESGQKPPIYTQVVIFLSDTLVHYGVFVLIGIIIIALGIWRYSRTPNGKLALSRFKLSVPYLGTLYTKLYLSRIADNLNIMLQSAIPIVRALEITGSVVDNAEYETVLKEITEAVRGGTPMSEAFGRYPKRIPGILVQMMKVGEETGESGNILKTMATFYGREVVNAVDAMVSLIEPLMIILLGLGVGFLLAAVLIPIYNISAGIS